MSEDRVNPAPVTHKQGLEALLDDVWNAAIEQAAVIANDRVHLTPDPGSAIRVMIDGRAKLHQSAKTSAETKLELAGEQWRAIEDGHPKTSWCPVGYGDKPGWDAIAKRNPEKYQVEIRKVFATPASEGGQNG